jgi:hypothetical protein
MRKGAGPGQRQNPRPAKTEECGIRKRSAFTSVLWKGWPPAGGSAGLSRVNLEDGVVGNRAKWFAVKKAIGVAVNSAVGLFSGGTIAKGNKHSKNHPADCRLMVWTFRLSKLAI